MRSRSLLPVAALVLSLGADSQATDAGPDPVVVRVGESEARASELRFLLGRLHEFERETYGKTAGEVRRGLFEKRLVLDLLFAEEGKQKGALGKAEVAAKIRAALAQALKAELERSFDAKLSRADLEAYCKSSGGEPADAGAPACSGDLSGYRVVIRRTRAAEEMERLAKELREREVKQTDYALLERLVVRTDDSVAPAPSSQR